MDSVQKVIICMAALMLATTGDCAVSGSLKPIRKRHVDLSGAFVPSFGVPGAGLQRFAAIGSSFGSQVSLNPNVIQSQGFQPLIGQNLGPLAGVGSAFPANAGIVPSRHTFSTIDNAVAIRVPQPVPVQILRHVPVPVRVAVPVDVPRAVQVIVPQAVGVPVPRAVPVDVPRAVAVRVPQAIPFAVTRAVGVPVPQPIAVRVPVAIPAQASLGNIFGSGIGLSGLRGADLGQGIGLESIQGVAAGQGFNVDLEAGVGPSIGQLLLQSGKFNLGAAHGGGLGHGVPSSGHLFG